MATKRIVVIGLVTNPLCRAGDVAVLSPSRALDRAIARGWVEVTHAVEDGAVTEGDVYLQGSVELDPEPPVVEVRDDEDALLAMDDDGDESPGGLPWEDVPLFE